MVLPLVDQDKPKCYICHDGFSDVLELREHQKTKHGDSLKDHDSNTRSESAPGDVTVF